MHCSDLASIGLASNNKARGLSFYGQSRYSLMRITFFPSEILDSVLIGVRYLIRTLSLKFVFIFAFI